MYVNTTLGYFNGLDALDADRVCVAGELDTVPGGFGSITCTWDGGATWTTTYMLTTPGASMFDIRAVGTDGYIAVGGVQTQTEGEAIFLYSGDAGKTWTLTSTLAGQFASSVDCARGTESCWATLLDVQTQQASLAFSSSV